jgi:ubiquinone/menaquinone biosynthesis C-methylase UbiE
MSRNTNDSYKQAIVTEGLKVRANANQKFGSSDFDGWVKSFVDEFSFTTVLDICCGTGNQLVMYAERPGLRNLIGVDVSVEALATAKDRLYGKVDEEKVVLVESDMDGAFRIQAVNENSFDLVACCYGLYYSRNAGAIMDNMIGRLDPNGTLMIVGPYGKKNNASIFDVIERHFELPELPRRSSRTFMEQEVLPFLDARMSIETRTFVNTVIFPDVEALINYWRATTFYRKKYADAVEGDFRSEFDKEGKFVVEKHVMAAIGRI